MMEEVGEEGNVMNRDKEKINMFVNIDNYSGQHTSRLGPTMIYILVCSIPLLVYISVLAAWLPFKVMAVFEVFWAIRWALIILCDEKGKLANVAAQRKDQYSTISKMVRITQQYDDGMLEYFGSTVAYCISGYTMTYSDDNLLAKDLAAFFRMFEEHEHDIRCQVGNPVRLQDKLSGLSVYTDKDMMKERMDFYIEQDTYCDEHVKLYTISVTVKAYKDNWKKLRDMVQTAISSDSANCFKEIKILNREEVEDMISRDIRSSVNLRNLLMSKFDDHDFKGSRVLYYGEEVPEEMKAEKEKVDLKKRRVVRNVK